MSYTGQGDWLAAYMSEQTVCTFCNGDCLLALCVLVGCVSSVTLHVWHFGSWHATAGSSQKQGAGRLAGAIAIMSQTPSQPQIVTSRQGPYQRQGNPIRQPQKSSRSTSAAKSTRQAAQDRLYSMSSTVSAEKHSISRKVDKTSAQQGQ
jgi:hypothetical protein